ncbi:MAG: hypothetical protein UDB11_04185 [Peptococcaceae bacterium]|nr:hypothetical protein [Peptococcaceae bacterium]
MLRSKGLTDKLLLLGVDGMDPRFIYQKARQRRKNAKLQKANGYRELSR